MSYDEQVAALTPPRQDGAKHRPPNTAGATRIGLQPTQASPAQAHTLREPKDRVETHGNQFEDEDSAIGKLKRWAKGTVNYSNDTVLSVFYELPPKQRNAVYLNKGGILYKMLRTLSGPQSLQVMNMCDFPLKWKIKHSYKDADQSGITRELMIRVIQNAPLSQRHEVATSEMHCDMLQAHFAQDHPENLFGDDLAASYYPTPTQRGAFWGAYPWYGEWADRGGKLDATARWSYIAGSPSTRIGELKGKPAAGGRNQWTSLLHWGPRGAALTDAQSAHVDTTALDAALPLADKLKVLEVRLNLSVDITLLSDLTPAKFETLYNNLVLLPPGTVHSDTIRKIAIYQDSHALGSYTDLPQSADFGTLAYDTHAHHSLADLGHTVRHEMRHQTDTKYGGFTNLLSVGPTYMRKYMAKDAWLDELTKMMGAGGNAELKSLLSTFMDQNATFANPHATSTDHTQKTLWQSVSNAFSTSDIKTALDLLKAAGVHNANGSAVDAMLKLARIEDYPTGTPAFVGDRYFGAHYGEFFSWHKAADEARNAVHGRSDYTLAAPYETYADLFAAYFATKTGRDTNVPSWAAGHFAAVAKHASRDTQKSKTDRPTTAEDHKVG